MDKRYLIIIGVITGLIIIGLIAFWIFRATAPETAPAPTGSPFPSGAKMPAQPTTPTTPIPTIPAGELKQLTQLTQKPISGATFISSTTTKQVVRYFEKATGHIYDIDIQKGESSRISNTTIPGIFDVHWLKNGEQAIIRYIENNETGVEDAVRNFIITSISATSTRGIFLSSDIKTVAASPKGDKIFYLSPYDGLNFGITATPDNKKQKQVLSIPFGEFLAYWPSDRAITLLTKPSAGAKGYFYKLDSTTSYFDKILGSISGLTALLSPDGENVIYSEGNSQVIKTYIYNIKENKSSPLALITMPDKCVWSKVKKEIIYCAVPASIPGGTYPDDWYQGLISFSDRIWKIDISNGSTEIISAENNQNFDFINPFLSKDENYIFFQDKKDGTLWSLKMSS